MISPVTVKVLDFSGCPFAVSADDGDRLRSRIAPLLHAGTAVSLSFAGIEAVIGAFVNAALGPLCRDFSDEQLGNLLTYQDIRADDRATVDRSIRNARAYYANPAAYNAAWAAENDEEETVQEARQP